MDEEEKPFACSFPGCEQRFSNNDHLTVHQHKHTLEITFPGRADSFLVDQTPTPTRFLRLGEDAGLFDALRSEDIPKSSNPFDVGFKEATIKNLQTSHASSQLVYPVTEPVEKQEQQVTASSVKPTPASASFDVEERRVMTTVKTLNSSDSSQTLVQHPVASLPSLSSPLASSDSSATSPYRTVVIPVAPPTAIANPTAYIPVASVPVGLNLSALPKINGTIDVKQQIKQNIVSQNPSIVSQAIAQTKEEMQLDEVDSPTEMVRYPASRRRTRSRTDDGDPDTKRKRFLERNRAAATRCREKRKQWIVGLEKKADDVTSQNTQLQQEVVFLKNEVAQLKSLLLAHKDCPVTVAQQEQMKQLQGMSSTGAVATTIPSTNQQTFMVFTKAPGKASLAPSIAVSKQDTPEQVATTLAAMAQQGLAVNRQKVNTTGIN